MAVLKYKDPITGDWIELSNAVGDTLPIGAIVEYDGTTVPTNWEKVNDYSTEEVNTGNTWIDGKPIYRKVMSLQSSTAGEHLISFSDLNADFITIEDFYIKSGNFVFSYNRYNSATDLIEVFINQGTSNIVINVGNSWANFRAYIIIEYTKTTD